MTSMQQMMAEFAARGGQVKKVAQGVRAYGESEMYALASGPDQKRVREIQQEDTRIREVINHKGRSHFYNAQGEWL